MNLRTIRNHIIFQFVDNVNSKGEFERGMSAGGIFLHPTVDDSAKMPRWANVTHVGPECEDVKVGQQVLIPALRWTAGTKFENQKYWKTDLTQIVAVRDNPTSPIFPLTSYILFQRLNRRSQSDGGLFVSGGVEELPSGVVFFCGPKCNTISPVTVIYFDGHNFFDTFRHDIELSFIKEDAIIAYYEKF